MVQDYASALSQWEERVRDYESDYRCCCCCALILIIKRIKNSNHIGSDSGYYLVKSRREFVEHEQKEIREK